MKSTKDILNKMEKKIPGVTEKLDGIVKEFYPEIENGALGLRENQIKAIEDILSEKDVMVLMPTAGGKSACYQIPALYWENGITIVISPLSALIIDQVAEINKVREVATIFAGRNTTDMYYGAEGEKEDQKYKNRIAKIISGRYRLIYVTPEMLNNPIFLRVVRNIRDKVKMVAVDEAHCISMWGYDFRPSYLSIKGFISSFSKRPVVSAFTATATNPIVDDILRVLNMKLSVVRGKNSDAYDRADLTYHIRWVNLFRKLKETDKKALDRKYGENINYLKCDAITDIIMKYVENDEKGIIYCSTTNQVELVASYIEKYQRSSKKLKGKLENRVSRYYGKDVYSKKTDEDGNRIAIMDNEVRNTSRERFVNGNSLVLVATSAFGMGINMSDIRYIIHFNMPISIEQYCQEIGRAARRPGMSGDCYLLYNHMDVRTCSALINSNPYSDRREKAQNRFIYFKNLIEDTIKQSTVTKENNKIEIDELRVDSLLRKGFYRYFKEDNIDSDGKIISKSRNNQGGMILYVNRTYVANEIRKGDFSAQAISEKEKKNFESLQTVCEEIEKGKYRIFEYSNPVNYRILPFRGSESTVKYRLYNCESEQEVVLSYFDMMIADAVYSLWLNNIPISHKSIWKMLSGDENVTVQKEKKKKILDSLYKLTNTYVSIVENKMGKYGLVLPGEESVVYGYEPNSYENAEAHEDSEDRLDVKMVKNYVRDSFLEYKGNFLTFKGNPLNEYHLSCYSWSGDKDFDYEKLKNFTGPWELEEIPPLYLYAEIQCQFHVFIKEQLFLRTVNRERVGRGTDKKESKYKYIVDENRLIPSSEENTILKHYLLRRMDMLPKPGINNRVVKDYERVIGKDGKKVIKALRAKPSKVSKRKPEGIGILSNKVRLGYGENCMDNNLLTMLGLFDDSEYCKKSGENYKFKKKYQYSRLHKKIFGEVSFSKDVKTSKVSFSDEIIEKNKPVICQILDYYIWLSNEMRIGNLKNYTREIDEDVIRFEVPNEKKNEQKGIPGLCTYINLCTYTHSDKRAYSVDVGRILSEKRRQNSNKPEPVQNMKPEENS